MAVFDGSEAVADRVVLADFDISIISALFTNYSPYTWVFQYGPYQEGVTSDFGHGCFGYGDFGGSETGNLGENRASVVVGSVIVDANGYVERASIALVEANEESWYWDNVAQRLYVRFEDSKRPLLFTAITVGGIARFANKAVYVDDNFYEPRVVDPVSINKTRDPVKDLVIAHDLSSLKLRNNDGAFDSINQDPIVIGQPMRIWYGIIGAPLADFLQVGKSYIEEIGFDWKKVRFKLLDDRKKLSRKIPLYSYDSTSFSDIKAKNLGKPIQLAFGELFNVLCVCVDEDAGGTPTQYRFTISSVEDYSGGIRNVVQVYVDGIAKVHTDVLPLGVSTIGAGKVAYFRIATADYDPGQKVTADIIGLGTRNMTETADCESTTSPQFLMWTPTAHTGCTFARDAAQQYQGSYSYKQTMTATGSACAAELTNKTLAALLSTIAGRIITCSVWVYVPSTSGPLLSEVHIRMGDNDGGGFVGQLSANPTSYDTWQKLTLTRTFRTGLTQADIKLWLLGTVSNGEYVYWDDIQIEEAASATDWILREYWDNPLRLEEHLMEEYANIDFDATNFDLTEWNAAAAHANVKDVAVFVNKRMETKKVIEKVQTAVPLGAFLQLDNGKWTQRIYDAGAGVSATIIKEEIIGIPDITYDKNYATSVEVQFAKDWSDNEFRAVVDDSEESVRVGAIKKYFLHNPQTMIVNETDALDAAALWYAYLNNRRIFGFRTRTKIIALDLIELLDVDISRLDGGGLGTIRMEIAKIKKDLTSGIIDVVAREVI